MTNITPSIREKIGRDLHRVPHHPLTLIKERIAALLPGWELVDTLPPEVSTAQNFDELLIPADHPARGLSDTYYVDDDHVLRTHTSAHQRQLLLAGKTQFLVVGDVYRKDAIDATHYPVFHQMEGVCILAEGDEIAAIEALHATLIRVVEDLFPGCAYRFATDYFPFTVPSFEMEVEYNGQWLEVLGCGVIHPEVMRNAGRAGQTGYAFGLGLERLAMILFDIPDIRYFWTSDPRFLDQFRAGEGVRFQPYSKYPPVERDVAFWHGDDYHENELTGIVREIGGDLVENVALLDAFVHPKTGRASKCYRTTYRSHDRSLTNEEINQLQERVRAELVAALGVELR